jgi:hypothetical protein
VTSGRDYDDTIMHEERAREMLSVLEIGEPWPRSQESRSVAQRAGGVNEKQPRQTSQLKGNYLRYATDYN